MKFKNILLTMLLILAVLSVGAVSAADGNATSEDIAVENDVEDALEVPDASDDAIGDVVQSGELFNITVPEDIKEGIPFKVTFTGASDLNGKLEVTDIEIIETSVKNGSASFTLNLESGVREVCYSFSEFYYDSYYDEYIECNYYSSSFSVTVNDLFDVSMPESIFEGETFKVTFTAPSNINGELYVEYGGEFPSGAKVKNGKATVTIENIPYTDSIDYMFSNSKIYIDSSVPVNVLEPPKIKADNFKTLYSSKKQYKARILDNASKPIVNKTVTFELYGYDYKKGKTVKMATKTAKTDKNGYAKVRFNIAPEEYKVKIKYPKAKTVTKKYVIGSIIKPKQIYKKKGRIKLTTAKRFEFGASLKKVDGKVLKGKNVKITFYRQDYKGKINHYYWGRLSVLKTLNLKTNSKGVVKKTYTKLPFKVLKEELQGMIIEVKISYGKDEQWVALNVRSLSPIYYYFI